MSYFYGTKYNNSISNIKRLYCIILHIFRIFSIIMMFLKVFVFGATFFSYKYALHLITLCFL